MSKLLKNSGQKGKVSITTNGKQLRLGGVYDPKDPDDAVNLRYFNEHSAGGGGFDPSSSQTITGNWEFTKPLVVKDAVESDEAVNKGQLDSKLDKAITEVPKTGSFTVDAADAYKLYVINSASAVTVTFPTGLSAGLWWDFITIGTGTVTFVAGSSATLVSADSRLKLRTQYSACRIVARGSNQGLLTGDIVL